MLRRRLTHVRLSSSSIPELGRLWILNNFVAQAVLKEWADFGLIPIFLNMYGKIPSVALILTGLFSKAKKNQFSSLNTLGDQNTIAVMFTNKDRVSAWYRDKRAWYTLRHSWDHTNLHKKLSTNSPPISSNQVWTKLKILQTQIPMLASPESEIFHRSNKQNSIEIDLAVPQSNSSFLQNNSSSSVKFCLLFRPLG